MEVEQTYSTSDAILAITLFLSGCEPVDIRQPCTNLFDEAILFALGGGKKSSSGDVIRPSRFSGMTLNNAANAAWEEGAKGHVQFHLKLNERTQYLIKVHREQMELIEKGEGKSFDMLAGIIADMQTVPLDTDEAIMRAACVILKTRGELVNLWKQMVPLLRVPVEGKVKHFDTTAITNIGKTVAAKGVQRPGCKIMSLNISEAHKKELKP